MTTIPSSRNTVALWGDAPEEMPRVAPDIRVVNRETAITRHGSPCLDESIHCRPLERLPTWISGLRARRGAGPRCVS